MSSTETKIKMDLKKIIDVYCSNCDSLLYRISNKNKMINKPDMIILIEQEYFPVNGNLTVDPMGNLKVSPCKCKQNYEDEIGNLENRIEELESDIQDEIYKRQEVEKDMLLLERKTNDSTMIDENKKMNIIISSVNNLLAQAMDDYYEIKYKLADLKYSIDLSVGKTNQYIKKE